jgi:hypothetical protein
MADGANRGGGESAARRHRFGPRRAALGVCAAVALLAGVVQAKSWKKLAPSPLASDSTYAAFLARPSDSLTAAQLSWLAVQRDWRAQREAEGAKEPSSLSITDSRHGYTHHARPTDARFAALASQAYAALPDTDRAWLVAENAAQRVDRESPDKSSAMVGIAILAAIAGAVAATVLIVNALNHSWY